MRTNMGRNFKEAQRNGGKTREGKEEERNGGRTKKSKR